MKTIIINEANTEFETTTELELQIVPVVGDWVRINGINLLVKNRILDIRESTWILFTSIL